MSKSRAKLCQVQSLKNNYCIADQCVVAESFMDRLRGLIGKKLLRSGEGLLLSPCNDIHMWMMSIPIDVVFIKRQGQSKSGGIYQVTSLKENLKPWRLLPVRDSLASDTLELPAGSVATSHIQVGDELCIS